MPKITQQVCVDCPECPEAECPEPCCNQIPNPILCISIPCPVQIVLLGIELQLNLPCLALGSPNPLTPDQIAQLLEILEWLIGLLDGLPLAAVKKAEA